MQRLKQMLIIEPKAVMNGFCYVYSLALLVKIQNLVADHRIFEDGNVYDESELSIQLRLSDIGSATIYALSQQIPLEQVNFHSTSQNDINKILKTAEEFLAIFQKN